MRKSPGITALTDDVLKSAGLILPEQGFSRGAEILSDSNRYPGIAAVRFGDTENIIRKRLTAEHRSVISEISEITDLFQTFYVYDEISGTVRNRVESIPVDAFRRPSQMPSSTVPGTCLRKLRSRCMTTGWKSPLPEGFRLTCQRNSS